MRSTNPLQYDKFNFEKIYLFHNVDTSTYSFISGNVTKYTKSSVKDVLTAILATLGGLVFISGVILIIVLAARNHQDNYR